LGLTLLVICTILLFSIFIGAPVAFALGFTGIVIALLYLEPQQLMQMGSIAFSQATSMNQLVAPLFILMAEALAQGDVASDIFMVINKWMGKIRGGLALSATLACTVFAALCGSSPATAAAIGRISISEMVRRGYSAAFATGTVASGGTLGIMIPPSITFVVYGILTENSIVNLFMSGVLPGIMMSTMLCGFIILQAWRNPALVGEGAGAGKAAARPETGLSEALATAAMPDYHGDLKRDIRLLFPPILLIALVLGSLYTGLTTPSESAGVGAIGALVIVASLGRFNLRFFSSVLKASARTSTMIIFLIICGMGLTYIVSYLGLAQEIANAIVGSGMNKWWILTLIYILWFILGCLMDPMSMVVLTIPFIYPTMLKLGFDPIWLGVVSTLSVEIGMITPPVGLNLFILKAITGIPMTTIMKGTLPFVMVLVLALIIITIFPEIALFLPYLK
jgi:tripartite ATP-independent transporter DctM subunit